MNGSSGIDHIYLYGGDPTGASTNTVDAPLGSLFIDTNGGPLRVKTSNPGDNTGFSEVRTIQYTAYSPLTAASLTFNALGNDEELYLTPAGTIAALTITFPTDALSRIGQQIGFTSTQIVTALTLTLPGSVTIVGTSPTALAANSRYIFIKVAANTWIATSNMSGLNASGAITSSSPTAGIGYATGAGGAVTQATNRTTGVTINTVSGQITTNNASLAAETAAEFVVTNSACAIGDVPVAAQQSGSNGGNTDVIISTVAAGSFRIKIVNNNASGGTAETGAIIINYAIIKAVAA